MLIRSARCDARDVEAMPITLLMRAVRAMRSLCAMSALCFSRIVDVAACRCLPLIFDAAIFFFFRHVTPDLTADAELCHAVIYAMPPAIVIFFATLPRC